MPRASASPDPAAICESAEIVAAERQKFIRILDVLPPYVVLLSPDYPVAFANREFQRRFGAPNGRRCYELLFQRNTPCEICETYKVLQTGTPLTWEWEGPDGRKYEIYDLPFTDTDGSRLILEMGIDITQRMQAEAALRQSEAQLRAFLDHSPVGICRTSVDQDRFLMVNSALVQMLGYEHPEELLGLHLSTDVYRDSTERVRVLERLRQTDRFQGLELHWRRKQGDPITLRASGRQVVDSQGAAVSLEIILEDISEYRKLEDRLRQVQKLDAIGRMAGGVAHEFNNLLMIMSSYADLMLQKLTPDDPLRRYPEQIMTAARRATTLTSQLLAFSHNQVLELADVDINSILHDLAHTLPRLMGEDISLKIVPGTDVRTIRVDPGQMEQVLLNLSTNARDAMPKGGLLMIETFNVTLDAAYCKIHGLSAPGDYVLISVSDTGSGIDSEVLPHIFEPFFTTKERGKGTGLGLSMVYGIVKQCGGAIWAYSEPGHGCTFKLYFPAVEHLAREAPVEGPSSASLATGSETVLLVEDEDALRESTREGLESLGYKVLTARSGEDALALASNFGSGIDLLLTDLVMPGMNGKTLADRLCVLRPHLCVLFISGYSDGILQQRGIIGSEVSFLQKPFDLAALARQVRHLLRSREKENGKPPATGEKT